MCARERDGDLYCWGRGAQLGLSDNGVVQIDGLWDAVSVSFDDYMCGITQSRVECWGDVPGFEANWPVEPAARVQLNQLRPNATGPATLSTTVSGVCVIQDGQPSCTDGATVVPPSPDYVFAEIHGEKDVRCAVGADHHVFCFGGSVDNETESPLCHNRFGM